MRCIERPVRGSNQRSINHARVLLQTSKWLMCLKLVTTVKDKSTGQAATSYVCVQVLARER
jgi:hypothetical protein